MKITEKWTVGIDEAGRGPLAGPVSVGVFGTEKKMQKWLLQNIFQDKLRDSKKLSAKKREEIYKKFLILRKESKIFYAVSHISNKIIDEKGISYAIKLGIKRCLKNIFTDWSFFRGREFLDNHKNFKILLDGSLKAPQEFKNQKTIIKGDEKEVLIACASIVAKVLRDRLMDRLGSKYPHYAMEVHKGYGTKLHYKLLQKHGISPIHRNTFLKSL